MWKCKTCGEENEDDFAICWKCGSDESGYISDNFKPVEESEDYLSEKIIQADGMILINTSILHDIKKIRILGLVCSETIVGTDVVSKVLAEVVNVVGGTSQSYSAYIQEARRMVTEKIINQAREAGANTIFGIKYDYESIGNGMLMVSVTGTAAVSDYEV